MVRLKRRRKISRALDKLSQFHYGSIKTETTLLPAIYIPKSQFHYGSIKTKEKEWFEDKYNGLNSTMVRLKRSSRSKSFRAGMSQFHYGSIKTKYWEKTNNGWVESQFHYGSIKT